MEPAAAADRRSGHVEPAASADRRSGHMEPAAAANRMSGHVAEEEDEDDGSRVVVRPRHEAVQREDSLMSDRTLSNRSSVSSGKVKQEFSFKVCLFNTASFLLDCLFSLKFFCFTLFFFTLLSFKLFHFVNKLTLFLKSLEFCLYFAVFLCQSMIL